MTTATTTPEGGEPQRRSGFSLGWLLLLLVLGIVVAAGLLVAFPPTGLIKDQVAEAASKALGRPVSAKDLKLSIWPDVSAELSNAAVLPAAGGQGELLRVETIRTKLKLKPLLSGVAEIESLELVNPVLTLVAAADGGGNWTALEQKSGGTLAATLLNGATITGGSGSYTSPKFKQPITIENLNGMIDAKGRITAKGQVAHHGELAALDVTIEDGLAAADGKPSAVTLALDGKFVALGFIGTASGSDAAGDVSLTTPSVANLGRWMGSDIKIVEPKIPGSIKGKIRASGNNIGFENADAQMGPTKGRINGNLAMNGSRPKFSGTIAMPRLDLNGMMATPVAGAAPETDDELELDTAPAWAGLMAALNAPPNASSTKKPTAPPAKAPAPAAKAASWSTTPIDLKILKYADLDAVIETDVVAFGKLDLTKARIKTVLEDGKLDALIHEMTVGPAGSATGKLILDSRKAKPTADFAITMKDVAAEPIITEISGKPLLAGTSNVEIVAKGEGLTQTDLASSLDGKARFRMTKGHIRGFDVRSIVSNWWNSLSGGLKFDINKKTGFEKLDAQYDIKRGVMTSSPGLDIGGSEVQMTSKGQVNLPTREINQEIRVKVVPPPTAPPIPVKISGSWSKPSISMDWADLLFSAAPAAVASAAPNSDDASSAAPTSRMAAPSAAAEAEVPQEAVTNFQELAPTPEQVPDDVKDAITKALKSNKALTDDGRELLKSLIAEPVPETPAEPAKPETVVPEAPTQL
jgi:AsmA protein